MLDRRKPSPARGDDACWLSANDDEYMYESLPSWQGTQHRLLMLSYNTCLTSLMSMCKHSIIAAPFFLITLSVDEQHSVEHVEHLKKESF